MLLALRPGDVRAHIRKFRWCQASSADTSYAQGIGESWKFDVDRVNDAGCLQTALHGEYGEGNYYGINGAGYAPIGSLYVHWGQEIWLVGFGYTDLDATVFDDLRCDGNLTVAAQFWKGVFLR